MAKRKCNRKNRSGKPCGNDALPGKKTCFFHSPEHAKAAKKGGKATAAMWKKRRAAAKRWPIGQSWEKQIEFLETNIGLAMEEQTRAGKLDASMWNKQLIRAMEARDKTKGFGNEIHVHLTNPKDVEVERDDGDKASGSEQV